MGQCGCLQGVAGSKAPPSRRQAPCSPGGGGQDGKVLPNLLPGSDSQVPRPNDCEELQDDASKAPASAAVLRRQAGGITLNPEVDGWMTLADASEKITLAQFGVHKRVVLRQADGQPSVGVREKPDDINESERWSCSDGKVRSKCWSCPNGTDSEWISGKGVWTQIAMPTWQAEGNGHDAPWVKRRNLQIPVQKLIVQHADGPIAARNEDGAPCFAIRPEGGADLDKPLGVIPNSQEVTVKQLVGEYWKIEWKSNLATRRGESGLIQRSRNGGVEGFVHWKHLRSLDVPRGAYARCANEECCCTASYNGLPGAYCCQECMDGDPCKTNVHQEPDPEHQMVRGNWAPCKRSGCPCTASWNGAFGEFCCVECRDGTPCTSNKHHMPTKPGVMPEGESMILYHGTTMDRAKSIQANGFYPSSAKELLGEGVYFVEFQNIAKAKRFAHDVGKRFKNPAGEEGDETLQPVLLKCKVIVGNLKKVGGNDRDWKAEGYDACRASKTSMSVTPEWCVTASSSIKIEEVLIIKDIDKGVCPFADHKKLPCWAKKMNKKCPCEY